MLPIEFIVKGTPVTSQSKNKERLGNWKQTVKDAAKSVVTNVQPVSKKVSLSITYYYEDSSPDVDNILKPIQDALEGIVYINDSQIQHTSCCKKDIDGSYRIRNGSPLVIQGFIEGDKFLHIKIEKYHHNNQL